MAKSKQTEETVREEQSPEEVLLTPIQFIETIGKFIRDADPEATISVGELQSLIDRTLLPGKTDPEAIKAGVLYLLREHVRLNPKSGGESSSNIWRKMRVAFPLMLDEVDESLNLLVSEKAAEASTESGFTLYLPTEGEKTNKT